MRHRPLAVLIALGVGLVVSSVVVACSPFSGADSPSKTGNDDDSGTQTPPVTVKDGSADPPTGDAAASDAGFDFTNCTGGTHLTEGFENASFPNGTWMNGSYGTGKVALTTSEAHTGTNSLAASLSASSAQAGAALSFMLPPAAELPRALRVSFAYKPELTDFVPNVYAEVGCNVVFNESDTNNLYLAYSYGTNQIGLVNATATPAIGFQKAGWYTVSQELHLTIGNGPGDVDATLQTTLSSSDGTVSHTMLERHLEGAGFMPVELLCGVPYATSKGSNFVAAYLDDISIDICP